MPAQTDKKAELQYILAVLIYGTIGCILRYISVPSEIVVFFRGLIGSLFTLLYLRLKGRRPDTAAIRANLGWLVFSGICLGLNWIFLFAAYLRTSVAIASLCNYMAPAFAVLLSPVLFRERLTGKKLLCVFAALVGIVLVSGVIGSGAAVGDFTGILLGLLAAAAFVGILFCNRRLKNIGSLDKTVVQLAVSALTVLPYAFFANRGSFFLPDSRSVLLILLLGVVHTGIAYILYFGGMGRLPTLPVAVLGYLEPVVSVLCSVLLLREPMAPTGWLGAALIIGAALLTELL